MRARLNFLMLAALMTCLWAVGVWSGAAYAAPARWLISDEDTSIILLGTIHTLKPETNWLDSGLEADLARATALYLELAPSEQLPAVMNPLVVEHGLYKEGKTLKSVLDRQTYTDLMALVKEQGLFESQFAQLRPWLAGVTITAVEFAKNGYNPLSGVEATLTRLAQAKGVPVKGLETAEFQIKRFGDLSEEQEIAFLKGGLSEIGKAEALITDLTDAWLEGDTETLGALMTQSLKKTPDLAEVLLYERNRNWTQDIQNILEEEGIFIVAVGAGHLSGEQNLLELLRQQGMTVVEIP